MSLKDLRAKIDAIDEQILSLLSDRGCAAASIAKIKQKERSGVFVPSRERQILEHLTSLNSGPLPAESVRAIFEQIIAACRLLESPISVAYLGPPGTYSNMAALRKFGADAIFLPAATVEEVFSIVEKKKTQFGVVPVENSIAGFERTTLDRFVNSSIHACAECYIDVQHNLLCISPHEEIKRVYSHPQGIDQCRNWLRANLPSAETVEVSSTARAAQLAAEEPGSAAIGTELAASLYNLPIVASSIQDRADNRTRFLVIGRDEAQPSGKDKTSLVFAVPNRPGSLWEALAIFQHNKINMMMIESRPTKQNPWEYVFFADVQGHCADEPLATALRELANCAPFMKVLGSYPEAE